VSISRKILFFLKKKNAHLSIRVVPPWPVCNQPQPKRGKREEELEKPLNKIARKRNMKLMVLTTLYRGET